MKTQRAKLGCRLCHIDSEQREDLDFDTFLEGRYHHTVMSMREYLEAQPTRQTREAYGTNWGIDPNPDSMVLTSIAPGLIGPFEWRMNDWGMFLASRVPRRLQRIMRQAGARCSYTAILRTSTIIGVRRLISTLTASARLAQIRDALKNAFLRCEYL